MSGRAPNAVPSPVVDEYWERRWSTLGRRPDAIVVSGSPETDDDATVGSGTRNGSGW